MLEKLIHKLHTYLIENHPDLLLQLQEEGALTSYLQTKMKSIETTLWQLQESEAPEYVIEEICMDSLTEDLKTSRFNYICTVLSEQFPDTYATFQEKGILTYEAVNLVEECASIFESTGFSLQTEESPVLHQVVIGIIRQYLSNL